MPVEIAADAAAGVRQLSYAEAIREGLAQAMEADPRVFLFGEDVGVYGGAFGVSGDLLQRFGPERVIASSDCGFAQGPFHRRVHPTVMWAKLEALVEGARLASKELWR